MKGKHTVDTDYTEISSMFLNKAISKHKIVRVYQEL